MHTLTDGFSTFNCPLPSSWDKVNSHSIPWNGLNTCDLSVRYLTDLFATILLLIGPRFTVQTGQLLWRYRKCCVREWWKLTTTGTEYKEERLPKKFDMEMKQSPVMKASYPASCSCSLLVQYPSNPGGEAETDMLNPDSTSWRKQKIWLMTYIIHIDSFQYMIKN